MPVDELNLYTKYYIDQAGSGLNVFRGARSQRGYGIGNFFKSLFRAAIPLFKSGARAIGHEALETGRHFLEDVAENKPIRQAIKTRLREAGHNLTKRAVDKISSMSGKGLKGMKRKRDGHSSFNVKRVKLSRKRAVPTKRKIKKKRKSSKKKKSTVRRRKKNKKKKTRRGKRINLNTTRDIFA